MSTDRRRIKRSRIKPKVAAAYLFGQSVKNIMADHGVTNYGNLYRTLAEYGVPLRQPNRSAAIRAAMVAR